MDRFTSQQGYPRKWGWEVFEEWYTLYPRATDFLCELYGFPKDRVVDFICDEQKRWLRFKKCAKKYNKAIQQGKVPNKCVVDSFLEEEKLTKYMGFHYNTRLTEQFDELHWTSCDVKGFALGNES